MSDFHAFEESLAGKIGQARMKFPGLSMVPLVVNSLLLLTAVDALHGHDQFAIPRPFRRCFANEEFSECASPCEPTCKDPNPGVCTMQCVAGCQCKPGFLRNEHGACVADCKNESLKPMCGPNEEFKECGTACEPSCREPRPKVCTLQCVVGCQCKPGYFRNDKNECVAECDNASGNICPENEEFKQCGTACEPTCENPRPLVCTAQCILNVCQCKPGYFRNSQKKCVAQCGSESHIMPIASLNEEETTAARSIQRATRSNTCGVNEEMKACGTECEPTCENPNPRCSKKCVPNVCQCMDTFLRDANGKCIPEEWCPKQPEEGACGTNEERVECGTACEPTCSDPKSVCTKQCVKNVCRCRFGFIRNSKNLCIPTNACPPSEKPCGTNEERKKCGTACEPTCADPNPRCTKQCINNVCQCRFGFIRNSKKECIPTNACPASERPCGTNEERVECGTACEPTCEDPNPTCTKQCIKDVCRCRFGFVRNSKNQCIPTNACPAPESHIMPIAALVGAGTTVARSAQRSTRSNRCGVNEELKACGSACEPSCANPNPVCTTQCIANVCQCMDTFLRDSNGRCIPEEWCPKEQPCGVNEERVECGTACEPTCSNPNPVCTKQCIKNVCRCRFGFIRNSKNQCIPTSACPPSERPCGTNEERKECGTACEPTCANPHPTCSKQCIKNVCQCRFGFIRNSKNQCIPTSACPPSETTTMPPSMNPPMMCGPHETWKSCSGCEPTCTNMNPACGFSCGEPRCECDPGFFRSRRGPCVTMQECRSNLGHR
ncbi:trypsin Inhibitor like cysteine rich domain protein [Ancylostoma duodenale]|uniref:Trypsin Inhibitor like cysteine rich domain protein n=1 Tax=Ancylostoma duodenale TaxID=51022 RepID=A0A0C2GUB0_9BILA|nr:trypsin Inhibitor like cysteine rich domain protein [Ancylostoma duodenale]